MTVEVNGRPKDISYSHLATLPPPGSVCVTPPPPLLKNCRLSRSLPVIRRPIVVQYDDGRKQSFYVLKECMAY